jgi:hypothetical protein
MEAVIGVMSKRSVALAAAEKPGASRASTSWLRRSWLGVASLWQAISVRHEQVSPNWLEQFVVQTTPQTRGFAQISLYCDKRRKKNTDKILPNAEKSLRSRNMLDRIFTICVLFSPVHSA